MSSIKLQKGRVSNEQFVYHVTFNTQGRIAWFEDFSSGRVVVRQMKTLHEQQTVNSFAWVVMPDHIHWLFQLNNTMSLSAVVKNVKATSALILNKKLHRKGSIWQRGFYDHALRDEEDYQQVARYIVANPLRAGLVKSIGDYALWDAVWL